MIADTMLPAAPVTTNTQSRSSTIPAPGNRLSVVAECGKRDLDEGDTEAVAVGATNLDAARILQRLFNKLIGDPGGRRADGHIDRLDDRLRPFLAVRLRETGDRTAERVGGAGRVVAVEAAEPGGRNEERAAVVERGASSRKAP